MTTPEDVDGAAWRVELERWHAEREKRNAARQKNRDDRAGARPPGVAAGR